MTYRENVAVLLMYHFGLMLADCFDDAELVALEACGLPPFDAVNDVVEKRDLSRIDGNVFMPVNALLTENI